MNLPLVSVIIPNYNYARFLTCAIDGVLAQTYPNIETIIVDDGSTDDSLKVLEGYGDRIRVIAQKNQGVSAARNNGIALSNGEFVAFLDADDVWLPEKIEKQVNAFLTDDTLGMVHTGVEEIDAAGTTLGTESRGLGGNVWQELLLLEQPVILGGGSGIMLRSDTLKKVGSFDTSLSTSADWDFFYRVAKESRVAFIPETLLQYRLHGSNMHGNIRAMENDVGTVFMRIFSSPDETLQPLRKKAYGNMHYMLSGSFFRAGEIGKSIGHAVKSIYYNPGNFTRIIKKVL